MSEIIMGIRTNVWLAPKRHWLASLVVAAVAVATLIGTGPGIASAVAAAGPARAGLPVDAQALTWALPTTLRAASAGPDGEGQVIVGDGAVDGGDAVGFPVVEGHHATTAVVDASFAGSLSLRSPRRAVEVDLSGFRLVVAGESGTLVADVTSRALDPVDAGSAPVVGGDDVAVATLDLAGLAPTELPGGLLRWAQVPVSLTDVGAAALDAAGLAVGPEVDPVSFTLAATGPAVVDGVVEGPAAEASPAPAPPVDDSPADDTPVDDVPADEEHADVPDPAPVADEVPAASEPAEAPAPTTPAPEGSTSSPASVGTPAVVAVPAAPAVLGAPSGITGGHLDWGVKASFRNYITGPIARGQISTGGGASTNADGTFRFPARAEGDYDPDTSELAAAFDGSVTFSGHGYHGGGEDLLQMSISNIRIDASGGSGVLIADVVSLPLEGDITNPETGAEPTTYSGVALADLDLGGRGPVSSGGDGASWADVPATLAAEGAPAFSDFYTAGTALDPVSFTLTLADAPDLPDPDASGDGGESGGTGATIDKELVAPGGTVTVTGEGFMGGEQVEVWVLPDDVWVATEVADASGRVTATFALPASVGDGQHQVELRGISSGTALLTPTFTVGSGSTGGSSETSGSSSSSGASSGGRTTMPRTGTDPGLAVAGGVLVLLGLALVAGGRARRAAPRP